MGDIAAPPPQLVPRDTVDLALLVGVALAGVALGAGGLYLLKRRRGR